MYVTAVISKRRGALRHIIVESSNCIWIVRKEIQYSSTLQWSCLGLHISASLAG